MRWLVNYLRQMFCAHSWTFEEEEYQRWQGGIGIGSITMKNTKVSVTCTKCAYHTSYLKF